MRLHINRGPGVTPGIWLVFSSRLMVGLEFKLEDLWVGAFWRWRDFTCLDVWICAVPCFPLHVIRTWER